MFEDELNRAIMANPVDRSFVDKLLAKQDVDRIRDLVKKTRLSRDEILELLYLCISNETKLVNLSEYDRYLFGKFFVWIREYTKVVELMFDYKENLDKMQEKNELKLSDRSKKILDQNERLMEHNTKFLVDLFLMMLRTSLSIGATGFLEILKNKYEVKYDTSQNLTQQQEKKGWLHWSKT